MEESRNKWTQFVSGNKEAYSWIYKAYIQDLYRYGLRFSSNPELIKDCIQEVFTYIYKNRTRLNTPDNVKVYLFIALKNNILRALSRKEIYEEEENAEEAMHFSLEPTVEDAFIEKEEYIHQQDRLKKMFEILTPRQQEIIYYRFAQELSYEEICQLMNLNYQSAQNLIQRSLQKIRTHYSDASLLLLLLIALYR
ncbi:sigma-70 family RNA polymerase sigma factor [Parabacteroides sp. OttesenSCG-928-G06]|nr:sigma-70 family RNA polymerase sigma factor [Parabacteroides sp. OttesenSCG-928-G06]